jgi:plastocyanin
MSRTTLRLLMLALTLTFALAACSGATAKPGSTEPKTIAIALNEFQFQPAEITVNVGQPIKLVLKNNGTVLHDFVSTDAMVGGGARGCTTCLACRRHMRYRSRGEHAGIQTTQAELHVYARSPVTGAAGELTSNDQDTRRRRRVSLGTRYL